MTPCDLCAYQAPDIIRLGSLPELTGQILNKMGMQSDFLTQLVPVLHGDITILSGTSDTGL